MAKTVTIIWDYPRDNKFAFDIEFEGKRFDAHRNIQSGMLFAAEMRIIGERFGGFRYITKRKAFVTAFPTTGEEPRNLINALERHGYTVRNVGSVDTCLPIANAA